MIKSFKRLLVFSVCALVLPICVKADGFSVNVTCSKLDGTACPISNNVYQVSTGEKVNLTFTISSTDAISFSGTVSLSDKITGLSDFDPNFSYWADLSQATGNNGYENDRIGLMKKNTGASGDPKFSFSVTGGNITGNATVEISSISIMNAQNTGVNIDDVIVNLAIVESSSNSNTNTNENTNAGTNTNENANTNENTNNNSSSTNTTDNTKSASDDKKTESKKPVNPDTGVTLSALGIVLLVVVVVSYIALRKKNYFNKI